MIERKKIFLFVVLLIFGLSLPSLSGSLIFPFSIIPRVFTKIFAIGLAAFFFFMYVLSSKEKKLVKYKEFLFAFFIASFAICLDILINLQAIKPNEIVFDMLLSSIIIVTSVITFTKVSGYDLSSIYLKKGKIKLSLITGLIGLLLFLGVSVPGASFLFQGQNLNSELIISWIPLLIVVTLANGIREEILYRGIFLKKFAKNFDFKTANVLQAMIFSLSHSVAGLGISSYTQDVALLVLATFILGVVWGFIIQKTDNLLGAILFHSGTDVAIFIGIFSNMV